MHSMASENAAPLNRVPHLTQPVRGTLSWSSILIRKTTWPRLDHRNGPFRKCALSSPRKLYRFSVSHRFNVVRARVSAFRPPHMTIITDRTPGTANRTTGKDTSPGLEKNRAAKTSPNAIMTSLFIDDPSIRETKFYLAIHVGWHQEAQLDRHR